MQGPDLRVDTMFHREGHSDSEGTAQAETHHAAHQKELQLPEANQSWVMVPATQGCPPEGPLPPCPGASPTSKLVFITRSHTSISPSFVSTVALGLALPLLELYDSGVIDVVSLKASRLMLTPLEQRIPGAVKTRCPAQSLPVKIRRRSGRCTDGVRGVLSPAEETVGPLQSCGGLRATRGKGAPAGRRAQRPSPFPVAAPGWQVVGEVFPALPLSPLEKVKHACEDGGDNGTVLTSCLCARCRPGPAVALQASCPPPRRVRQTLVRPLVVRVRRAHRSPSDTGGGPDREPCQRSLGLCPGGVVSELAGKRGTLPDPRVCGRVPPRGSVLG